MTSIFIDRYREAPIIVRLKLCGNKLKSPEFTEKTDRRIAHHLGVLQREFQSGNMIENWVENFDETHFLYDAGDTTSLRHKGRTGKYLYVVRGGTGMKVDLRMTGAPNAELTAPFLFFRVTPVTILKEANHLFLEYHIKRRENDGWIAVFSSNILKNLRR